MNKKLFIALLGAVVITASSYASEGETTQSFGVKAAKAVKTAVSYVGNVLKGSANLPNTVAHYFGYGKEMSTMKQATIASLFWVAIFYATKKAYEKYKLEQAKKEMQRIVNSIKEEITNDNSYEVVP